MSTGSTPSAVAITPEALLAHWQGHRRLTRRVIEAFPEDRLFSFSVGSMRPFGAMAMEMITMAAPMVRGVVTGVWDQSVNRENRPKEEVLRLWDESTQQINTLWPQIPPERFRETITAFGLYKGLVYELLLYVIDNEIHHRGQGYVYLRERREGEAPAEPHLSNGFSVAGEHREGEAPAEPRSSFTKANRKSSLGTANPQPSLPNHGGRDCS